MNIIKPFVVSVGLCALLLNAGCSGMKKLETENQQLKQQVSELEQVKNDYSDKLAESEKLSAEQKQQLEDEMQKMRDNLNSRLEEQIQKNEVAVQQIESLTVITLGESVMFGSGMSDLTKDGAKVIRQIADTLVQYPGYNIRVEGHTDGRPISEGLKSTYSSNWELSSARAISVIHYMIYGLNIEPKRLSIAAYAQYRPVADNNSKEGRAKNRRIRVVVFKSANYDPPRNDMQQ